VRIFLSVIVLFIGLVTAREFVGRSNDRTQLTLHGPEIAEQHIATANELPTAAVAQTGCEQIWDPATHMTKEEWAQTCRRVEDDRQRSRAAAQ
jgi:hypothetical protein